jgi:Icc-related predicted phosphoesterase
VKLVCISDTHGLHAQVQVPDGDILIHAGDVSNRGRLREVTRFLDWFAQVGTFRHRIMIAGNHDFLFEDSPQLIHSLIPDQVVYLNDCGVTLDGLRFWGSPVTPEFMDWAFNRSEAAIGPHWAQIPEDVDVLITHSPPHGILDVVQATGQAVGCPYLLETIQRVRPALHVFGHIHEGYGQVRGEHTLFVNASCCDVDYAVTQPPQVMEWPDPDTKVRRSTS